MVEAVDLELLVGLGGAWDSTDAEVLDSLDRSWNCTADCIIDSSFWVMLLCNDNNASNLFDILL